MMKKGTGKVSNIWFSNYCQKLIGHHYVIPMPSLFNYIFFPHQDMKLDQGYKTRHSAEFFNTQALDQTWEMRWAGLIDGRIQVPKPKTVLSWMQVHM